jgi:hypothetical protein
MSAKGESHRDKINDFGANYDKQKKYSDLKKEFKSFLEQEDKRKPAISSSNFCYLSKDGRCSFDSKTKKPSSSCEMSYKETNPYLQCKKKKISPIQKVRKKENKDRVSKLIQRQLNLYAKNPNMEEINKILSECKPDCPPGNNALTSLLKCQVQRGNKKKCSLKKTNKDFDYENCTLTK